MESWRRRRCKAPRGIIIAWGRLRLRMVNTGIWMGRRLVGWQAVTAVIGVAIVVSALIAASRGGIVRSDLVHAHVLKAFVEESVVFRFYDAEEQKAHDFSISFNMCVCKRIPNHQEQLGVAKKSHAIFTTVSFIPAIVEFYEAWYNIGLKGPDLRHRTSRQVVEKTVEMAPLLQRSHLVGH